MVKWKCRIERNFRLSDPNDFNSKLPRKEETFEDYHVLYDLKKKRFLLQGEYCVPWVDGEAPTIIKEVGISFDGKQYIYWEKRKKDRVNTKDHSGSAFVSDDTKHLGNQSFMTSDAASAGFGIGFPVRITLNKPNDFRSITIPELIKDWNDKKTPVLLQETQEGKWEIEGVISWITDSERYIRFNCDPSHDGVVDEFICFSRIDNKDVIQQKRTVEYIQNSQGKFVPSIARLIYPLDKLMTEFHYTDVEFNPKVSDESFQFKIPDGSYVTDYITKTYYKVGDLVDEDKAIDAFIVRHGLTGNVPVTTTTGGVVRYVLIVIGSLMILASIILHFRKRMQA
jgi:hypothetical protein